MAFEQLPNDPMLLLSVVNTKLRDTYADLNALCEDLEVEPAQLKEKLNSIGYEYSFEQNRFL